MEINLGKVPFDLDFHPSAPLVAAGLISGDLHLYRYDPDSLSQPHRLLHLRPHKQSCRALRFIDSGRALITGSPDCSIVATDVQTGARIARLKNAHGDAVNKIICLTETTIASGDDQGCIKVWDTRQRTCCNSFDAHEDFISDMTFVSDSMQLLGTSGDGTLSVCSLRKNKVQTRSEFSEDELMSVITMKNGQKVICGTQTGALLIYSWGHFTDCSDRFLGHPMSVDALLKLDEDTLISGSEDGVIRLVGILPNKIIHPIAEHSVCPIEGLAFSSDRKILGSISHDQMLKKSEARNLWRRHRYLRELEADQPKTLADVAVTRIQHHRPSSPSQLLHGARLLLLAHQLWDLQDLMDGQKYSARSSPLGESSSDDDEMDLDVEPYQTSEGSRRKNTNKGQCSTSSEAGFFADL